MCIVTPAPTLSVSENVDSRYTCAPQVAPSLIDSSVPFVDLNKVFEDEDMWGTHGDHGVVFNGPPLSNIPGYLKYVHDDGTEILAEADEA